MAKNTLLKLRNWLDDKLRYACGSLSKDARIIIIASFIIGGSILSIYWTVSSIYNIGKKSAEKEFMEIRHIERLELQRKDSINHYQSDEYGTGKQSEFE
mgnify:CR=1 FL=1